MWKSSTLLLAASCISFFVVTFASAQTDTTESSKRTTVRLRPVSAITGQPVPLAWLRLSSREEHSHDERETSSCARDGVGEAAWTCSIPCGRRDILVETRAFSPHWISAGEVECAEMQKLGDVVLHPGGTLRAWIDLEGHEEQIGLELVLVEASNWPSGDIRRPGPRGRPIESLQRSTSGGVLVWPGILPGRYTLEARGPGFGSRQIPVIEISAGKETEIGRWVMPAKPELEVIVHPAVGPANRPWQIEVSRQSKARFDQWETLAEATVPPDGVWHSGPLDPGEVEISILTPGHVWRRAPVTLERPMDPIFVDVDLIEVSGTVERGGEPVSGRLIFGGTSGGISISMLLDEEGRFDGYLPREGTWPLELATGPNEDEVQRIAAVDVKQRPGSSRARVEIALPDTRIEGRVLAEGEARGGAPITVVRPGPNGSREALETSDADGKFEILGAEPGSLVLLAEDGRDWSSGLVPIEVAEGKPTRVELRLEKTRSVSLQVTSESGQPIPGASVFARPLSETLGEAGSLVHQVTGYVGEVELRLPGTARVVDLLVEKPGFVIVGRREGIRKESDGTSLLILALPTVDRGGVLEVAVDPVSPHRGALLQFADGATWSLSRLFPSGRLEIERIRESFRYRVLGLAEGQYRLRSRAEASAGAGETFTLVAGGTTRARWSLEEGGHP